MFTISRIGLFVASLLMVAVSAIQDSPAFAYTYDRAGYGRRIEGVEGEAEVWWCEAPWKIAPQRPSPEATSPAALTGCSIAILWSKVAARSGRS